MNLRITQIKDTWINSTIIRIATFRDPIERFVSTYDALRKMRLVRSDREYLPFISKNIESLVKNNTAMKILQNGIGSGHFIPSHKFLLSKKCLTSHFLVNFKNLNDLSLLIKELFQHNATLRRINDPTPGRHLYNISDDVRVHIAKHYEKDFILYEKLKTLCSYKFKSMLVCKPYCN